MPVFWRCRNCRTLVGLNKKACPGCGAKPSRSKSQTYVVQVCYKKKRKSATVRSLTQAREVEARLKSQLIEEHHVPNPNRAPEMTFAEFCEKHYFPYAGVQNSSFRRAEPFFHKWILPRLGKKKLPEITPKDVEDLKATVLRAGCRAHGPARPGPGEGGPELRPQMGFPCGRQSGLRHTGPSLRQPPRPLPHPRRSL